MDELIGFLKPFHTFFYKWMYHRQTIYVDCHYTMIKFQQVQNRHTHSTKSTQYHSRKIGSRVVNLRLWFPASVTCPATATCFPLQTIISLFRKNLQITYSGKLIPGNDDYLESWRRSSDIEWRHQFEKTELFFSLFWQKLDQVWSSQTLIPFIPKSSQPEHRLLQKHGFRPTEKTFSLMKIS